MGNIRFQLMWNKSFFGQPSIVYFGRVCKIDPFRVSTLNCSNRSLQEDSVDKNILIKFFFWVFNVFPAEGI